MMNSLPQELTLGHAIAYVLIYISLYNDGEIKDNEFWMVRKSMKYWMGQDTSENDLRKLLVETDEWFNSGTNYDRLLTLDRVITIIKNQSVNKPSVLTELFEDCVFVCASNNSKYEVLFQSQKKLENDSLLEKLMIEFPVLEKIKIKLFE